MYSGFPSDYCQNRRLLAMSLLKQCLIKITSMSKQMFNVLVLVMLNWFIVLLESLKSLGFGAIPPLCPPLHYVISCAGAELQSQITAPGGCLHLPLHMEGGKCQGSRLFLSVTKTNKLVAKKMRVQTS